MPRSQPEDKTKALPLTHLSFLFYLFFLSSSSWLSLFVVLLRVRYRTIVGKALESDQTVKLRFQENEAGFIVLSKSMPELVAMLPRGPAAGGDSPEKTALRSMLVSS